MRLLPGGHEFLDEFGRIEPDGPGDLDELDDVDPTLATFVLGDERPRPIEPRSERRLRQARGDSHFLT